MELILIFLPICIFINYIYTSLSRIPLNQENFSKYPKIENMEVKTLQESLVRTSVLPCNIPVHGIWYISVWDNEINCMWYDTLCCELDIVTCLNLNSLKVVPDERFDFLVWLVLCSHRTGSFLVQSHQQRLYLSKD